MLLIPETKNSQNSENLNRSRGCWWKAHSWKLSVGRLREGFETWRRAHQWQKPSHLKPPSEPLENIPASLCSLPV